MPEPSLLAASLIAFLSAFVLAWLAWILLRRPGSSDGARTASAMFAVWWGMLALRSVLTGVANLTSEVGPVALRLLVGLQFMEVVAICVGLAGLLCYLVYLYTGRAVWFWPLMVGYSLYAGILVRTMMAWEPYRVLVTPWEVELLYARAASQGTTLILLFILIGPQLMASLALFALAPRLPRSASRVRLIVVAVSIFAWFGSAFLASASGVSSRSGWQIAQLFVPLLVGLGVLLVHRPPAWLRRVMPPELPAEPERPPGRSVAARRP